MEHTSTWETTVSLLSCRHPKFPVFLLLALDGVALHPLPTSDARVVATSAELCFSEALQGSGRPSELNKTILNPFCSQLWAGSRQFWENKFLRSNWHQTVTNIDVYIITNTINAPTKTSHFLLLNAVLHCAFKILSQIFILLYDQVSKYFLGGWPQPQAVNP